MKRAVDETSERVIYFCIPAFNEAPTVGVLMWKIRRVMEEFPRDYEVVVLDDGSTDETLEVLAPYARVIPLTVIRQEPRTGYAAAVERLIRETVARSTHPKRDVLVVLQADFTEAPEDVPALLKKIEGGADVVEAAVVSEGIHVPRGLSVARRGMPWILRNLPVPDAIRDPVSGFRAFRVSVLKRMLAERNGSSLFSSDGWAANVELIVAVAPHSRRTEGVEVRRRYDLRQRDSRFRPWNTLVDVWNVARQAKHSAPATAPPASTE